MPPGIAGQLIYLPRSFRDTSFHATAAYADVFDFFCYLRAMLPRLHWYHPSGSNVSSAIAVGAL